MAQGILCIRGWRYLLSHRRWIIKATTSCVLLGDTITGLEMTMEQMCSGRRKL